MHHHNIVETTYGWIYKHIHIHIHIHSRYV